MPPDMPNVETTVCVCSCAGLAEIGLISTLLGQWIQNQPKGVCHTILGHAELPKGQARETGSPSLSLSWPGAGWSGMLSVLSGPCCLVILYFGHEL